MLEKMREYLTRALPWDGTSLACVVTSSKIPDPTAPGGWKLKQPGKQPGKQPELDLYWFNSSVGSVDAAMQRVAKGLADQATAGIYLCQSTLQRDEEVLSRRGYPYRRAIRLQENVAALHSLFADVDVKPDAYQTRQEALEGIAAFLKATGLPKPNMVVGSGSGGFHLYWIMDRALSQDEWRPLAFAFAEATRRHGLKCDPQCSVDSVRILRVPETFNRKRDPVTRVVLEASSPETFSVEAIAKLLEPYKVAAPEMPVSSAPLQLPGEVNAQWGAMGSRLKNLGAGELIDLMTVAPNCAFVQEALDTGGAAFSNSLWNLTTLLATFAADGREMAHKMACGHAGYTHESTEELYERKLRERGQKNMGWPQCQSIQNAGCASCGNCPLLAQGKSPLNFAVRPSPTATPLAVTAAAGVPGHPLTPTSAPAGGANLPAGYMHDASGRVTWLKPKEDGGTTPIPVADFPIVSAWIQKDPWWTHFTMIDGMPPKAREISIENDDIGITNELVRSLSRQGILLPAHQILIFKEFIVAWNSRLKEIAGAVVESTPFGWVMTHGKIEGFAYAGRVWGSKGATRAAAASGSKFKAHYTPNGDLASWQDAMRMITGQKRPALDVMLAAAFGAPLMKFTGQSGVIIAAVGPSGIGKSAAMDVATAVWGKSVAAKDGLDDTVNSLSSKMGALRHLPLFWDEIKTHDQTQRFVKIAFQMSGGKEKSRLKADGSQRDAGEWQTLLLAASNDSILDAVVGETKTSTAGINRLFEYDVPGIPPHAFMPAGKVARIVDTCRENFGQAGLEYAKWLGANHASAAAMVAKTQDQLIDELKADPEERFWIAAITVCAVGATIANTLNLTDMDVPAMLAFMKTSMAALRKERDASATDMSKSLSVSSIVQQYLMANAGRHTLVTDRVITGRGRPPAGGIATKGDISKLDGVYIHIALEPGILRISRANFRKWLSHNGYTPGSVLGALQAPPFLANINASGILGAGTAVVRGAQEVLVEISVNGTELENVCSPLGLPQPANVA